nr:hypothetical protein Hi04_10k_c1889_00007 [uncultured bacterium]
MKDDNLRLTPCALLILLFGGISSAFAGPTPITLTGSSGQLSASVTFDVTGANTLTIVLTNTSSADVLVPSDLLTAVFFKTTGTLSPIGAALTSGSGLYFSPGNSNDVGADWGYATTAISDGNSNSGFEPVSVARLQYGITSAGDDLNTGSQDNPLIKNSVTFTLSTTPDFDLSKVHDIQFQYSNGSSFGSSPAAVPEPISLISLGLGLSGVMFLWWRKQR